MQFPDLSNPALENLPEAEFRDLFVRLLEMQRIDRQENQLLYYQPVPGAQRIHDCDARVLGIGGGNGSSKTESALVDMIMCATGVFPTSQRHLIQQKFRGPINCRVVCESLTTVLHPIMLPKLQWWRWSGVDRHGGERGHWGWIPKACLRDGDWTKSWSEKLRILTLLCRDTVTNEVLGESSIQFMSVDQDATDFASGDYHMVLHDEPCPLAIWRENEARTMRVNGRMLLAMTWPDDPAIAVDWIYNEVYEPGLNENEKQVRWFVLDTTDNPHLNQEAVQAKSERWSEETRNVRIHGQPIRFSNRIHPDFTDFTKTWCFSCHKAVIATGKICPHCNSDDIEDYCHVQDFDASPHWPTIFLLDPHPRKPHMWSWVQVDPADDLWQIAEGKIEGDPTDVAKQVNEIESAFGLFVARRVMDPNMGATVSGTRREVTWQDEFRNSGIACELGDDSEVGRKRINAFLKPDSGTRRPRLHIHARCKDSVYQMNRYVWDEFKRSLEKDLKQTPKTRYDDYPTLLKYCLNTEPQFNLLRYGAPVFKRGGTRRGAY